jgi:hypothetical protein
MADSNIDPDLLALLAGQDKGSGKSSGQSLGTVRDYLSGNPYQSSLTGGSDISVGAGGPAPAPGVNVGAGGAGGSSVFGGPRIGTQGTVQGQPIGGNTVLGMLTEILGDASKANQLLSLFAQGPTRGGDGSTNQSLSDQLRSATGGAGLPFGEGSSFTPSENTLAAMGSMSPAEQSLFSSWAGPGVAMPTGGTGNMYSTGLGSEAFNPANMADPTGSIPGGGFDVGGAISSGAGVASGLYGLANAAQTGDPIQIASAIASLGPATIGLVNTVAPELLGAFSGTLSSLSAADATGYAAAIMAAIMSTTAFAEDLSNNAPGGVGRAFLDAGAAAIPVVGGGLESLIGKAFGPSQEYTSFAERAGMTGELEGRSLQSLMESLPYVGSQQELSQLMNEFKSSVGGQVGGYGQGSGPYEIPYLPEIGPETHGMKTNPTDFASITPTVQDVINLLAGGLPQTGGTGQDYFAGFMAQRPNAQEIFTSNPEELAAFQNYPGQFRNQVYLPSDTFGQRRG